MIHARTDYDRIQDPANLIGADEPVILFRAQDVLMPAVLAFYADRVRELHGDKAIIDSVLAHEQRTRKWQRMNKCKVADMPADAVRE